VKQITNIEAENPPIVKHSHHTACTALPPTEHDMKAS